MRHAPWHQPKPAAAEPARHAVSMKAAVIGAAAVAVAPASHPRKLVKGTLASVHLAKQNERGKRHANARKLDRRVDIKRVTPRSQGSQRVKKQRAAARRHTPSPRQVRARTRVKVHPVRAHRRVHPQHAHSRRVVPPRSPKAMKAPKQANHVPKPVKAVPNVSGPSDGKKAK